MRLTLRGFLSAGVMGLFCAGVVRAQGGTQQRIPVLVELFTSEGCSSCPPADALLMKLDREQPVAGAQLIVLEEHVDYWEGQGWHDRFSSHAYTERQNGYGRRFNLKDVYTPEMVVDGGMEFVGNDVAKARQAIEHAAKGTKVELKVSGVAVEKGHVGGAVSAAGANVNLGKGDVYAALVDESAETNVKGGENGGKMLHHAGVVRMLVRIGSIEALGKGPVKFSLAVPGDAAAKERVVVFAQRPAEGEVVGAAMESVPGAGAKETSVAMR